MCRGEIDPSGSIHLGECGERRRSLPECAREQRLLAERDGGDRPAIDHPDTKLEVSGQRPIPAHHEVEAAGVGCDENEIAVETQAGIVTRLANIAVLRPLPQSGVLRASRRQFALDQISAGPGGVDCIAEGSGESLPGRTQPGDLP